MQEEKPNVRRADTGLGRANTHCASAHVQSPQPHPAPPWEVQVARVRRENKNDHINHKELKKFERAPRPRRAPRGPVRLNVRV